MAFSYNTETILSNERKLVIQFRAKSNATDSLSPVDVINPASFTSQEGKACSFVTVDRVWASNAGGCITQLFWQATNDYLIAAYGNTGSTSSAYFNDFTVGGWGGLKPPTIGGTTITANTDGDLAGSGTPDGKIQIGVTGVSSSDSISVIIEVTKHYA